jgi:dTDP-glucose 4,6-dehydratase
MQSILITGGAGFIGSHVVRLFVKSHPECKIVNLDSLTYAGNLENLRDIESCSNYRFYQGDIRSQEDLDSVFEEHRFDAIVHLAAESHVDRSIQDPLCFVTTNVLGTANLLEQARKRWKNREDVLFYHVSTDEVYGSLGEEGYFVETTPYDPRSPYSASKASSDHFVRAYGHTYGVPFIVSNCSNNYGSHQYPEKLIPLMIHKIKTSQSLPIYGKGLNVRDWLWVEDHARAIHTIFHNGRVGETYNIGGNNERKNIDLVNLLCEIMDEKLRRNDSKNLITYVEDRAGHDLRYAIDSTKLSEELGWRPSVSLEEGLRITVDWYLEHGDWIKKSLEKCTSL